MKRIGVVGLGKLGLPLSLVFAKAGFDVVGIDVNPERIKQIHSYRERECFEPYVSEYLTKYSGHLTLSEDYNLLKSAFTVIVITQTPSLPSGKFDTTYVEAAVQTVHKVNSRLPIIVSSNINLGTIDRLRQIHSRICYNPEFIAQGKIIRDFENPKFVVVGAYTKADADLVTKLWRTVHNKPTYATTPIEAEVIKLSLNVSYSLGITFANVIGELCEKFDANPNVVLNILYQDRRDYKSGLGFGGPCFPKDVDCLKETCFLKDVHSGLKLANLMIDLNKYTVDKWFHEICRRNKNHIAVLGVAYKSGVPYVYDSQPLEIATQLMNEGYTLHIYDEMAEEDAKQVLTHPNVQFHKSLEDCVEDAEVVFIGTPNYADVETDKPIINPWK